MSIDLNAIRRRQAEIDGGCGATMTTARDDVRALLAEVDRLQAEPSSWPYCGVCGEGEDAVECEGCGETGCDVCVSRGGLCDLCRKAGIT